MSAMPQTPKLTISTPITTAMMVLPSQFDEALRIPRSMGPTCWQEGTGSRPRGIRHRIPQQGITGLITHHKVAAASSQPWRGGRIEAAGRARVSRVASGNGRSGLLGHCLLQIFSKGIPQINHTIPPLPARQPHKEYLET